MTVETKYLPTDWIDEAPPTPQADVNTFIHRTPEGGFMLMPADEESRDEEVWSKPLEDGEIVPFLAHEWYGWHEVEIFADGTIDAPSVPAKANCFTLEGEVDTLTHSLAELARIAIGAPFEPGTHTITAYWWSDQETRYRFVVVGGRGRFEPCAGAH